MKDLSEFKRLADELQTYGREFSLFVYDDKDGVNIKAMILEAIRFRANATEKVIARVIPDHAMLAPETCRSIARAVIAALEGGV